jgi:hypothetical protein
MRVYTLYMYTIIFEFQIYFKLYQFEGFFKHPLKIITKTEGYNFAIQLINILILIDQGII